MAVVANKLDFIPIDLVTRIVAHLDAFSLCRLFLTGSLLMRRNLVHGCKHFLMVIRRPVRPLKSSSDLGQIPWPGRFISRFPHLKRVFIDIGKQSCLTNVSWNDLPTTIESLHIVCINAWTSLYDSRAPLLTFDYTIREYPEDNSKVFEISSHLPKLKKLKLIGYQRDSSNPKVNDRVVSYLPSTLTDFEHPSYVQFTDAGIASMPPALKALTILGDSKRLTSTAFKTLPPVLTQLTIMHNELSDFHIKALPTTLIELNIASARLTDQCVSKLPRNLKRLSITYNVIDHTTTQHRLFPSTLTYLHCCAYIALNDEDVIHLPRNLKTLILHDAFALSDDGIPDLPPSLTHFEVKINRVLSDLCVPRLPRKLRFLGIHWTDKITGESASQLPPNLTSLQIPECLYFEDHHMKHLPRSITSLSLRMAPLTLACRPDLPPNLTKFIVADPKLSTQFKMKNNDQKEGGGMTCSIQ
jgi:hypothetical protein